MFGILRYATAGSVSRVVEMIGRLVLFQFLICFITLNSQAQFVRPRPDWPRRDILTPPKHIPIKPPTMPNIRGLDAGVGDDDDEPLDMRLESFVQEEKQGTNVFGWILHPPKIILGVRVVDKRGNPIISGGTDTLTDTLNVEATLYLNGRAIRRIVLLDNGNDGDSVKGDGIYSGVFVPPAVGTYEFRAMANFVFYRNGFAFEKELNAKGVVFHVVPVPYPQFEGVSRGSVVRGNLQATARIFLLKKPYDRVEFPMDYTLVISRDDYCREIPMQRSGSKLTADFSIPKSGVYEIKVNLSSNIKSTTFSVSTNPVKLELEKPLSLLTVALYAVPVFAILIVVYLYYIRGIK